MARTSAPRCSRRGCKLAASLPSGLCRKHLKAECDRLFSLRIRARGHCESRRDTHAGNLQCAHGFSRRYLAVRWNEFNAWSFCAGCHIFYTHHPLEWDDWLAERWGAALYGVMKTMALSGERPDLEAVYADLCGPEPSDDDWWDA